MAKKAKSALNLEAALREQEHSLQQARRRGHHYAQLRQLQALEAYLQVMGDAECKTIGNGHPPGLHCLACTWNHIRRDVKLAREFWSNEERRNDAPS